MREFASADARQRELRDAILVPLFYRPRFGDNWLFLEGSHPMQRKGIDTVVVHNARLFTIDEKIINWPAQRGEPYTAFALEMRSCTNEGYESDGWMVHSIADLLLYCFAVDEAETALDCYLIDMPALKAWFRDAGPENFPFHRTDQINHTECRIVAIDIVCAKVPTQHFRLGECQMWRAAA